MLRAAMAQRYVRAHHDNAATAARWRNAPHIPRSVRCETIAEREISIRTPKMKRFASMGTDHLSSFATAGSRWGNLTMLFPSSDTPISP